MLTRFKDTPLRSGMLIGFKIVSEALGKLSTFVLLILSARLLSTGEFGILSLGMLAGWLISLASDLGLQIHLTKQVAVSPGRSGEIFRSLLKIRLILGVVLFGPLVLLVLVTGWPSENAAFLLIVTAQFAGALTEFLYYLFRGLSRSELESTIHLIHRASLLSIGGIVLFSWEKLFPLAVALAAVSAATLLITLGVTLRLTATNPKTETSMVPTALNSLQEAFPIGAGILFSGLYFRSDLFLIERWMDLVSVGLYNSVFRLIDALRLIPASVLAVTFPRMCNRPTGYFLSTLSVSLFVIGAFVAVAVSWQAQWIVLFVYGSDFLGAATSLKILTLALPLLFLNFALTHQLIAKGRQRLYSLYCAVGLVVNLSANYFAIPALGIEGAAWSTVITEIFLSAACIRALSRTGDFRTSGSIKERHA